MSNVWIHVIFLSLYFIGLVIIGIYTGKKAKTSEEYHLGGRGIGAFVSSLSFVAAYFSSVVIIGGGGFGYKFGLATIWVGAMNVLVGCFLAWIILGKKTRHITEKLNAISLPDFFKKRYNSPFLKSFSSIVIVLFLIIYNVSILNHQIDQAIAVAQVMMKSNGHAVADITDFNRFVDGSEQFVVIVAGRTDTRTFLVSAPFVRILRC